MFICSKVAIFIRIFTAPVAQMQRYYTYLENIRNIGRQSITSFYIIIELEKEKTFVKDTNM